MDPLIPPLRKRPHVMSRWCPGPVPSPWSIEKDKKTTACYKKLVQSAAGVLFDLDELFGFTIGEVRLDPSPGRSPMVFCWAKFQQILSLGPPERSWRGLVRIRLERKHDQVVGRVGSKPGLNHLKAWFDQKWSEINILQNHMDAPTPQAPVETER